MRGQVDKALPEPKKELEFEAGDHKQYKVKAIIDSAVYGQQTNNKILGFYYHILQKGYPEEENSQKPSLAIIYPRKLINTFHKEHPKKSIVTSPSFDFGALMARLTILKESKQKRGRLSKKANKRSRNQSIRDVRNISGTFCGPKCRCRA